MKRAGNLYDKIYDFDNLKTAHSHARKNKGWYSDIVEVEKDLDNYLLQLQESLINKTYHTSEYEIFDKAEGGKIRQIYKLPYYPDRICQWAILQIIEPYFMKKLISTTYSAIPGRGIHLGLSTIRRVVHNDKEGTRYCLKLDVRKYYPSINHQVLKRMMRTIFKDPDLLWILDEIIDSTPGEKGIPIGNYMSQWFGNIYLSGFDHWIKEVQGCKYYYRYMDDIVILHSSKERLHELLDDIKIYFEEVLDVEVKANYQIFPVEVRGIDFLGYRIFPDYVLVRKSTVKRMKHKFKETHATIDREGRMSFNQWCAFASYKGWMMCADTYRLCHKYISPLEPESNKFYEEVIKNGSAVHKCSECRSGVS